MENNEMKNPVVMELNDDALDNIHGGTSEIPTVNYPGVLMSKHQMNTDDSAEDTTKSDLFAAGFEGLDV